MSRIVGDDNELLIMTVRALVVPVVTTMLGSAITLIPVIANAPLLPPFGLLMLLGWRLLRPQLWPVWITLPLGLFDDLLSGQPLGSAMALWTMCILVLDAADQQLIWRDYWQEWLIGALMIGFCLTGGVYIERYVSGHGQVPLIMSQWIVSVLAFPFVLRVCARLDRWRLA